jgi:hypothetical protein
MTNVTAFLDDAVIARGDRESVTRRLEEAYSSDFGSIRVFEDGSGRPIDLDYWDAAASVPEPRKRGRPNLGVVAREVTLLPRHWEWLSRQRGGASATLRRLVEEASGKAPGAAERRDSAYRFLSQMCGDRLGYEEALRALYRGEEERFRQLIAPWPEAIRGYVDELLGPSD